MTPSTRRATAEYRRATPDVIEQGHVWYPNAHAIAASQAREYGVTIEQTSGIIAALSPRLPWGRNVMLAERLLSHGGTLNGGCLPRSIGQASRIYRGEDPLDVMGGPKTRAFYQAVLTCGESDTAVIDVHAWSMLVGQRTQATPSLRQYRVADAVMHRAADIVGVGVHEFQATTWLAWRTRFWKPGVHDHTPQEMLEGAGQW